MLSESFYRNSIIWEEIKKKVILFVHLPKDVLKAFKQANNELLTETAEKSLLAKKIVESQREFLGKAKDWFKITDEGYLQLR